MSIAALWGTTAGYTECGYGAVSIETNDGRVIVIKEETFEYLYFRLDDFTAALKDDCIEYVVNEPNKLMFEYPNWFVEAVSDGIIFEMCLGSYAFYDDSGDIAMSPNSMVLRNYKGELMYMEPYKFYQYYDTLEE